MELKPGLSAIITGGASGIGRALTLALAGKGVFVTIIDFSEDRGKEVESLAGKECSKFHTNSDFPFAMFIRCDVTKTMDLAAAFESHFATYRGLDICINSAGIGSPIPFHKDRTDGSNSWRLTVNVNLVAVIDCTRLANIEHGLPEYQNKSMISQYQGEHGWKPRNYTGLCEKLLAKSQTVAGFFLVQYAHLWQEHLNRLFHLFSLGKLKVAVDPKQFLGLHSVADAVEYLHSGKSAGKVVVCIDPKFSQKVARL